ncbi:MAG: HAMP domain-containing protein [Spirochaetaceae bacterium]|nr:HAMP domain-containing protein [Spirochaetaceae bacterium]
MKRTLRFKVNVTILITFLAIAIIYTLIQLPFQERRIRTAMSSIETILQTLVDREMNQIANEIYESQMTTYSIGGRLEALELRLGQMKEVGDILSISIYDSTGEIMLFKGVETSMTLLTPQVKRDVEAHPYVKKAKLQGVTALQYMEEISLLGERLGYILIYYSLATIEKEQKFSYYIFGGLLGFIFLIMVIIQNIIFHQIIIKPIFSLRKAMIVLQQGALGEQIDNSFKDEFGDLTSTFNLMSKDLADSYKRIEDQNTELIRTYDDLSKLNLELEARVRERTIELEEANTALNYTIEDLQRMQDQLVQTEKIAALGRLVSGIAHEINTPIGVGITAISYLENVTGEILDKYKTEQLGRSDLSTFLNNVGNSSDLVHKNLQKASELIKSFKLIAVDQTYDEIRTFKLKEYIDLLLLSLEPKLRMIKKNIQIHCSPDLKVKSYPGAIAQILTNLIMNSLDHAFEEIEKSIISIKIAVEGDQLNIEYSDNGAGMTEEVRSRIFEPFYTTKRGQGGTGLGLSIVFNIVNQKLKGSISCKSSPGEGSIFDISIPYEL